MTETFNMAAIQPSIKSQPKYMIVAARFREQILAGQLQSGDRLPTFSQICKEFGVTLGTVERAYSLLEQEQLIDRQQGRGTFVANPQSTATGNIGFVGGAYGDNRQHPFSLQIVEGAQQSISRQNQHLLYMGTDYSLNLDACAKMDGVLICNIEDTAVVANRLPILMPRISMLIVADGMPSVVADDYRGARNATQHLMNLGHRRIACLMEKRPSIPKRRFAGYVDAMQEAGIEVDSRWMQRTAIDAKSMGTQQPYLAWARMHITNWLQKDWRELGCTAIVVQNEMAAIGVMQVLQQEGIKVPDEVSVIGFDGTEICDLITPRLTAMQLPLSQIGFTAVDLLNRQIAGEDIGDQVIMLPMQLREGGSVTIR